MPKESRFPLQCFLEHSINLVLFYAFSKKDRGAIVNQAKQLLQESLFREEQPSNFENEGAIHARQFEHEAQYDNFNINFQESLGEASSKGTPRGQGLRYLELYERNLRVSNQG